MGRGGNVVSKQDFKKRARSKDKGSDDSDEDYAISDEDEVSEDELEDYCSPVDGYASEEDFDSFVDEEEEEEEDEEEEEEEELDVKKVASTKARKSSLWDEKNGVKTARKKKRVTYGQDEDYEEEEEEEEDVKKVVTSKAKKSNLWNGKNGVKTERKRKRVMYSEDEDEDEDEDYEEEEEDEDEEFTPDEDICLDEEEELVVTKKNNKKRKSSKLSTKGTRKKGSVRGRKRRKSKASKKPSGKKGRSRGLRRKERSDDDEDNDIDLIDDMVVVKEQCKKNVSRKRRRYVVPSDSDFVSSGPSDYEYTITEEGREQVREANQLCGGLKTILRNSSSSKIIEEDGNLHQPRKTLGRKGKEKIQVMSEVAKQVCGICLSEEDKRRLRGTLNCCSHYFCFTCIMEWSKVESRCPLCKQRFKTITKPERSTACVDLRSVVIQVPERDQVYQPSEEDLRSFLDPYENVICSECHQGGDDSLMLLCDICDSSAHTYCVGLGRVVPEGNWYCDGCRPVAVGSSSSQAQDPLPDQRTMTTNLNNRPSPIISFGEGFDTYSVSSPRVPLTPGSVNLSSPRFTVGDVHAASPGSGAGAPTLSGRRVIQRRIQDLLSMNRMNFMVGSTDGMPTANLSSEILNSQVDQDRVTVVQPARARETEALHQAIFEERFHYHPASLVENGGLFAPRLNHLGRQAVQDPTITAANGSVNLTLWPEHAGINSLPSFEQLHQCSGISNIGTDGCVSPFTSKDEFDFCAAKEQLQSVVESHLKNLSRDIELDRNTFKDVARSSTHTILAACGLDHSITEAHIVPPPSICSHVERASEQTSLMKGHCSSCFDSFVRNVVKRIMDTRLPQWLSLGL